MKTLITLVALLCAFISPAQAQTKYVGFRLAAAGNTAPTLIATDIVSGSKTGGENNKGAYLRLYGCNFGLQANMGSASGARVYIGGNEVDNYRALIDARTSTVFDICNGSSPLKTLIVQVGALGGSTGALDVKVTVAGQDSNILTGGFTTQPGRFWFFDNVNGCDSTSLCGAGVKVPFNCAPDDITKPCRYVQRFTSGTTPTGAWAGTTPNGDAGIRAGDTLVLRASATWVDNVGCDAGQQRFVRICDRTGTVPTGSGNNGYIHFTAYPGAANANSPEQPHFVDPSGGNGGIMGANSANGFPNTPTYARYISISGLWLESSATSVSDAAPINGQYGASPWRVVDNELGPWPSSVTGAGRARAAGWTAQSASAVVMFNYIHDIASADSNKENHCIYMDGNSSGSGAATTNTVIAYNWLKNCTGGSGIQFYDPTSGLVSTGNSVYNNYIDTWNKYGININTGSRSIDVYNNILTTASSLNCIWLDNIETSAAINITHNNCYMANATNPGGGPGMIGIGSDIPSGSVKIQHNTIVMGNARSVHTFDYLSYNSTTNITTQQNLYFDPDGFKTSVPSEDSTGIYGNPNFTNYTGNFRTTAGGAGIAACTLAEAIAVATDFYGYARPVTGTGSPGATKNDIGATQGIGT